MAALGTALALLMCLHNYVSFHSTEQWQRRTGSHARMSTASTRYTCTEKCCAVYPLQLVGNKFNALLPSGYGCVSVLWCTHTCCLPTGCEGATFSDCKWNKQTNSSSKYDVNIILYLAYTALVICKAVVLYSNFTQYYDTARCKHQFNVQCHDAEGVNNNSSPAAAQTLLSTHA